MRKTILLFVLFISSTAFLNNSNNSSYSNGEILLQLYSGIQTYYVDELNSEELTRYAADAMLKSLDPYSYYISESEQQKRANDWKGIQYGGIGIKLAKRDTEVVITDVTENYPAQIAGMSFGESIIAVNSISIKDLSIDSIHSLIRGIPGTTLKITTKNEKSNQEYQLTRVEIKSHAVPFAEFISPDCAYISLRHFLIGSSEALKNQVIDLKTKGAKKIVIDIRGNSGGLVDEALRCVNIFISKGLNVYTSKGRSKEWNKENPTDIEPVDTLIPLAILIDRNSISAAEIFAGAIQDYDRGILIGTKTFGKGFVQGTRMLAGNNSFYMTSARYFTPSGRCIQELDYRKKDPKGNPTKINSSDSIRFYTKHGRPVKESGGIEPDIPYLEKSRSDFIVALLQSDLISQFADAKKSHHIKFNEQQDVTESMYNEFMNFASKRIHKVVMKEETNLNSFEKSLSAEDQSFMNKELEVIHNKLKSKKIELLRVHKNEITVDLEKEIRARFEYEKGRYRVMCREEETVGLAKNLLNDQKKYKELLGLNK